MLFKLLPGARSHPHVAPHTARSHPHVVSRTERSHPHVASRTVRSHPLACEESPPFQIFCPRTIFVNNSRTPDPIFIVFSEKRLYTSENLYIKFEAYGSHSFSIIVNCVISQSVTHLDANCFITPISSIAR